MSLEYLSAEQAFDEACLRLENKELQERVTEYVGGNLPPGFKSQETPIAVFAPYLAKGTEVEIEFLRKAQAVGFTTLVASYADSAFVTANPSIVDCYRAPLKFQKGQQVRKWVVPIEERNGRVGYANTIYPGIDILSYWQAIRQTVLTEQSISISDQVVDFSEWYKQQALKFGWKPRLPNKAPYYYMAKMAIYASGRAVLFDLPYKEFDERVIVPAARAAQDRLGVKPLVTDVLTPQKREWVDLRFLNKDQVQSLLAEGRIDQVTAEGIVNE